MAERQLAVSKKMNFMAPVPTANSEVKQKISPLLIFGSIVVYV